MLLSALLLGGLLAPQLSAPVYQPPSAPSINSPVSDRRDTISVTSGPATDRIREGVTNTPVTLIDPITHNNDHNGGGGQDGRHPKAVPEIDPASTGTALAFLTGGLLLIRGRRRSR
jgi:hypothetical protein